MQCIDIGGIRNMAKKHMQLSRGCCRCQIYKLE